MTSSQLTYPTQRAFVVQLHAEAHVAQGQLRGRVEHLVSGQAAYFQSMVDLTTFIVQVLSSATEESASSAAHNDP
jgi:hypothetical protein